MKKNLLLVASLFIGATTYAQFIESNSPTDGDEITLYIIDSLAPAYANETGSSANWDYSSYSGYENADRNITGLDATGTANAASFPNATVTINVEGFLKTYSSTTSTELTGHGFVFTEPNIGEIVAKYDSIPTTLYSYPMDENSVAILTEFHGEIEYELPVIGVQTSALQGTTTAKVDGKGTLKLADNEYLNVLRYKIIDTMYTSVAVVGDVKMVRVQYEYYDHVENNLPIFIHTSIDFQSVGGSSLSSSTLVMSMDEPSTFVGLSQNELAKTSVYPVPATNELNIQLSESVETANVTMTDVQGRQVYSTTLNGALKTIDVSNLRKGMYIVNISNGVASSTRSIIIE